MCCYVWMGWGAWNGFWWAADDNLQHIGKGNCCGLLLGIGKEFGPVGTEEIGPKLGLE